MAPVPAPTSLPRGAASASVPDPPPTAPAPGVPIVPLYNHHHDMDALLARQIVDGLRRTQPLVPGDTPADAHYAYTKTLPTMILYDQQGLTIYDQLTKEPDYYLFAAELAIFAKYRDEIARRLVGLPTEATQSLSAPAHPLPPDVPVHLVELGAGSLRKTVHLIRALSSIAPSLQPPTSSASSPAQPPVTYHALDLDRAELVRTLTALQKSQASSLDSGSTVGNRTVGLGGLWATYDQGLEYIASGGLKQPGSSHEGRRAILWLGSSIGNLDRGEAADMLTRIQREALRPGDVMLIGMDRRNDPDLVARAYDDRAGWTAKFLMNGLTRAQHLLDQASGGRASLDPSTFEYVSRYNEPLGRHEAYYRSLREQDVRLPLPEGGTTTVHFAQGELVHVEQSIKYSSREARETFDRAGLRVVQAWEDDLGRYDLWLLEKPPFYFPTTGSDLPVSDAATQPVPTNRGMPLLAEWDEMWKAWDTVAQTMISAPMMHVKPIDLRHICLFYLGHVPGFVDIFLARMYDEPHLNPSYSEIFERGIDPAMDTGTTTHSHSAVPTKPEDWPAVQDVVAYERQVQARIRRVYREIGSGARPLRRREARGIWQVFEHIALHMETLLYMLVQSPLTLPPLCFSAPDWASLRRNWEKMDAAQGGQKARRALIHFPGGQVVLGHHDVEAEDFDHALPRGPVGDDVREWNALLGEPEFGWDIESPPNTVHVAPFSVRAGPVTNGEYAAYLDQLAQEGKPIPVPASWVELPDAPATQSGSVRERYGVKTVYGPVRMEVAALWPVQASGMDLQAYAHSQGGRLPTQAELRVYLSSPGYRTDRAGTNVGLRNWHPVPAELPRRDADGQILPAHNGGVWEWTSTPLAPPEGYEASKLYPGYSSDFFDGQHWVVLGGSWASTPAIASRESCVNWYQAPYPYVFAGARVAFDAH